MIRFLAAAAAIALSACAPPAFAQGCTTIEQVVQVLAEKYGEHPVAMGNVDQRGPMIVFAAPTTGTWTLVGRLPNGCAITVLAGTDWRDNFASPPEPSSPEQGA